MNRIKFLAAAAAVAALVVVSACGKSSSPMAPSPSAGGSGASGATITGTLTGTTTASGAGYGKLDTGSGVTVTISGTSLTATIDSTGRFIFTNVPAGSVTLLFTSGGTTSTITLDGVQAGDTIVVKVTIKGVTVSLDTEERNGQTVTELEDRITSAPNATARTVTVGATTVNVPVGVPIRHGQTTVQFADLKVGDRVHVRGTMGTSVFTATEVIVQNTNANVGVNVNGQVAAPPTGSCPAITFSVGGWTVVTSDKTDFQKGACADVKKDAVVHVKGDVDSKTGSVLASWVQVNK